MKKFALAVFVVVMFAAVSFATQYSDVPEDHWAYGSVYKTTSAGLFEGYPDGTFGGTRNLTRYEYAQVLDRLMDYIDGGDAKLQELVFALTKKVAGISLEISENKKNLVDFMADLRAVETKLASNEQLDKVTEEVALALKNTKEEVAATKAELDSKYEEFKVLEGKVWDLRTDVYGEINGLNDAMVDVNDQIADLNKNTTDIEVTVKLLGQSLAKHSGTIKNTAERLGVVENLTNALTGNVFKISRDVSKLPTKADVAEEIGALEGAVNSKLEGYATSEDLENGVNLVYTKVLMVQDMLQKAEAANEDKFADMDELVNIAFDQIDSNITMMYGNEKKLEELKAVVATKAAGDAFEALSGKVTDMNVTTKMISKSIMNINKKIDNLDYVTPEQLSERLSVLYKMISENEGDIKTVANGVAENEDMIFTAFDQIDANITKMYGLEKELKNLEADLVANYATKEDFDVAMTIANNLTKETFLLKRNKVEKNDFKAYQVEMDGQLTDINTKLDDMAVAQTKFQKSTNVALVASFVAVAFSVVSLILK